MLTFAAIASCILVLEGIIAGNNAGIAQQQRLQFNQTSSSSSVLKQEQLLEDISFQIDNVTFSHHMASVNGIQMHYVMGGQGDPIVLLHGWPET